MNICFKILVVFLLLSTGCTQHYFKVKDNMVHIYLELPDAKNVLFLSSLDGYESHKLKKITDEKWKIIVPADIEFKYFFIVDGMTFLPECTLKEVDDFGSVNCIFTTKM